MAKPASRFKGKTVDLLRSGDDGFVRAEVLDIVRELGDWYYLIRYEDNGREALIQPSSIIEIADAHQNNAKIITRPDKFPRLHAIKNKQ